MKHLIVCCDGTWNTPDQENKGIATPTNVVKLRNCLALQTPPRVVEQRYYYHTGVGTEGGWLSRLLGGAFGRGLARNIQSAYHWLALHYRPGDQIFLFGYSRGAYTVRSLAGLLNRCGLPNLGGLPVSCGWARIATAFHNGYRLQQSRGQWARDWQFHHNATPGLPKVRFLGVWDTVGALGVPDHLGVLNLFDRPKTWHFHDTELLGNVEIARHAVALDEMRASFTPTLWTRHDINSNVIQMWFPGVHADIGGGYSATGLSDIALRWMIDEATRAGLAFDTAMVNQIRPDSQGVLHDSLKGVFTALPSRPRNAPPLVKAEARVHKSAQKRHDSPPVSQAPYRPTKVLAVNSVVQVGIFAAQPWNFTGLYLFSGTYDLTAMGEWVDRTIPAGPAGTHPGFQFGKWAHILGTTLGYLEKLFRIISRNNHVNFPFTRRHEEWPWFGLVGAVANADGPPVDGTPAWQKTFFIGTEYTLTVDAPGYFYAYANDAWGFYFNNGGSLTLTVKRTT